MKEKILFARSGRSKLFSMLWVASILLTGPNGALAGEKTMILLALGDSITAGTPGFYSPAERPPDGLGNEKSQYAYWMHQKHPAWTVLNRGVAGQRSDQIFGRFEHEVDSLQPEVVIVQAGINDLFQGLSTPHVETYLKKICGLALRKKIRVVACTLLPCNHATPDINQKIIEVNDWIRSFARKEKLLLCDTYRLMNDPQSPGRLLHTPDGLHPDVEGYRKIGEAIAETLAFA